MNRPPIVCPECGTPHNRDTPCPECGPPPRDHTLDDRRRGGARQRGYTTAWDRLSRRARQLQPWCSDCGSPNNLTADHSPAAWDRHTRGLPIRLQDIDIVCTHCNNDRGPARGPNTTDHPTIGTATDQLRRHETHGGEG